MSPLAPHLFENLEEVPDRLVRGHGEHDTGGVGRQAIVTPPPDTDNLCESPRVNLRW